MILFTNSLALGQSNAIPIIDFINLVVSFFPDAQYKGLAHSGNNTNIAKSYSMCIVTGIIMFLLFMNDTLKIVLSAISPKKFSDTNELTKMPSCIHRGK